jgi:hypothetical protein
MQFPIQNAGDPLLNLLKKAQSSATSMQSETQSETHRQTDDLKKLLFKSSSGVESSSLLAKPPSASSSEPSLFAILQNASASLKSSRRTSARAQESPLSPQSPLPQMESPAPQKSPPPQESPPPQMVQVEVPDEEPAEEQEVEFSDFVGEAKPRVVQFHAPKASQFKNKAEAVQGMEGARLAGNAIKFDVVLPNLEVLSRGSLDSNVITQVPSELTHLGPRKMIAVNPDYIAYIVGGNKVRLLHQDTGKIALIEHEHEIIDISLVHQMVKGSTSSLASAAHGADGNSFLATTSKDCTVKIWELPNGLDPTNSSETFSVKCVVQIESMDGFVRAVWSAQGDWLAIAGTNGQIWLNSFSDLRNLNAQATAVELPDGRILYSEDEEGLMPGRFIVYEEPITDLSLSSKYLATGAADGLVRLFELPSLKLLLEFDPHVGNAIDFVELVSLDGQLGIITAALKNREVKLSTLKNGHIVELHSILYHDSTEQGDWFNVLAWDASARTLTIANASRDSLAFVSLGDTGFTFMREYSLTSPVISLDVMPRSDEQDGLEVYAIQPEYVLMVFSGG